MKNAGSPTAQRRGLLVLCMASFLVPFMGSALNLALPQIGEEMSMNAVTLTWMATSYLMSTAILQVPFARIADMVGRRKIFLWGVFLFSACTLASGFAASAAMLLTLRILSGVGSAMMFGTSMAILTSLFPPEQRGRAMGINTAVVYSSLAAGPFLGGLLTHYFGWQSIFFVCAAVGLAVVAIGSAFIKDEWVEAKGERFDLPGTVVYAVAIFGLLFGFSALPSFWGFAWIAIGCISLTWFVAIENRSTSPLLEMKLFSGNRVFSLSSLAALINYAATSAIAFMMSLYLQYVRGFDASEAGLVLISQACVQALFSLMAGKWSDSYSPSRLATLGMAIIVAGLAGLIFISPTTPMWLLVIYMVLLGGGFGIFSSPNTNVIMSSVERRFYGQASATMGTMRLTGQAFSMGIAGMAISIMVGNNKIVPELHPDFMSSLRITFLIFFVLCLIGVYASSARKK